MNRGRARTVLTLGTAAVLAGVTACTGEGGDAAGEDVRPTIRYGIMTQGFTSMDPLQALQPLDRILSMMLFDGLVRYRTSDTTAPFEPGIARDIPQARTRDGKQVWTIHLRDGVTCPAGRKTAAYQLTSEDVVYSLRRAADPERSSFATSYTDYKSVTAPDPRTVEVTTTHPVSPAVFLSTISNWQGGLVVCKKAVEAEGDEFGLHPVGPGPYTFRGYTPGQQVELAANDSYYLGKPLAAGWTIRFMNDDTARQAALFSGDVDLIDPSSGGDLGLRVIDEREGFKVVTAPLFGIWYAAFNTKVKPLDDVRVRRALAYALDRADYVAAAGARTAEPVLSAWSDAMPGGVPDAHTKQAGLAYDYDLDKARELLAEAGYPDGFGLTVTGPSGMQYYEILQAQLKKIGIRVAIRNVDTPTWQKAQLSGKEPIIVTLIAYRATPQTTYGAFFYGPSSVLGGSRPAQNYIGYDGADALIEQVARESDPERQKRLWQDINDQILRDAAVKPLMLSHRTYGAACGFTWGGAEPPVAIPGNWQAGYKATVDRKAKGC
ncbi:ABC transporter substrate-binding protein [Sphaerisporangium krabiense]|uniref:Peptide/nickel transport system substrate-binding protein n=1 Tax=Sphaerisporangium krabiense TaxID=763782 RepID=A0A7W8Z240_9ACTN|nr:ABC transporter substrate-binding protein [Sphaerisporangium krabiense]MBB5625815.1 peptide/nickel transport system substrate-binding protein [Sphaerisporangium krabiense]GII62847.1 ABC transporter substrate-binding protein [Sphaerisporangium krabiense]